jgi:peroxiredoxin
MAQLEPYQDEISRTGTLVYIAAEKRTGIFKPEQYLQKNPISFPFLLDEDRCVTKEYGVYHRIGKDALNIARPATFVIGSNGIIRYIYVGKDQHDRAELGAVLQAFQHS